MNSTNNQTILVVEDDNDSRLALCAMLDGLGYDHLSFSSAKEAIEGIKGKPLALALLDIMMPEMNGYELMQKIREMPEFIDLPIIMVTAKGEDNEIIEGYNYGADYYITKPYSTKQLEYGIKIYLGGNEEIE